MIDPIEALTKEPDFERQNREARQRARHALDRTTVSDPRWPWDSVTKGVGTIGPGQLLTIAACSGNGKTMTLLNVASSFLEQGVPWIYFGLELADSMLVQFLAAMRCALPRYKVTEGLLTATEKAALAAEVESLVAHTGNMHFVPEARLTPTEVVTRARKLVPTIGAKIVILDHLHHLDFTTYGSNLRIGINDAMHALKTCANELGVSFLVAAQLSRRPGDLLQRWKVPSTSELKESGAIEQLSDVVLFTHRQIRADAWDRARAFAKGEGCPADFEYRGRLGLTVGKHRFGRQTDVTIPLTVHSPTDRITEVQPDPFDEINPEDRRL